MDIQYFNNSLIGVHGVFRMYVRCILMKQSSTRIGCYRRRPSYVYLLMSVSLSRTQMCYEHCVDRRATYMATQHGFECWCSHDADLDYARHSDDFERVDGRDYGLCATRCEGDKVSILLGTILSKERERWKITPRAR